MILPRERPEIFNSLCKMCYHQRSLPKSMVITCLQDLPPVADFGGGSADVYQCEYDGRTVARKAIRIYLSKDRDKQLSVGTPFAHPAKTSSDPDTYRGSVEKPSHGGTYATQTLYRCSARRWTCRRPGLRCCRNGWITAISTISSSTTEK